MKNIGGFFAEYDPEKAEKRQQAEQEKRIREQLNIQELHNRNWNEINKKWRIEQEQQNKTNLKNYRQELSNKNISVNLLTEAEISIVVKYWGTKISRDIIFNKCNILV